MSVTLSGAGGVFTRTGHFAGGLADVVAWKGGTATARVLSGASLQTRGTTISADLTNGVAIQSVSDGLWPLILNGQNAMGTLQAALIAMATNAVTTQVNLDANLTSVTLPSAVTELIRQMKLSSDSVNASTVAIGAQTVSGSPTGNPIFVVSKYRYDGLIWQNPFAESLRISIIQDSTGGATARQEVASIAGGSAIADLFAYNWPGGSGCLQTVALADAQLSNSGNNLLTNSAFETFTTANNADNWNILVGVAGTDIKSSATAYTLTKALQFVGDGATLSSVAQVFNTASTTTVGAGGTPSVLAGSTQYAVNFWAKCSAVPAAGVLEISLVDGSNTIQTDISGANCSFTVSLPGAGATSWTNYNGMIRTPAALPTTYKLRVRLSTALDNTKTVNIDDLAMTQMTSLYRGGPSVAGFAASTNPVTNDAWTMALTNTRGVMSSWWERMFGLNAANLILPYSGAPTVADSLVA